MSYTPGPWVVHPLKATVDAAHDGGMLPICAMLWPTEERSEDETEDNADLIAAAPDLLEALQELLDHVDAHCVTVGDCNQARAAIAKAEGRHA